MPQLRTQIPDSTDNVGIFGDMDMIRASHHASDDPSVASLYEGKTELTGERSLLYGILWESLHVLAHPPQRYLGNYRKNVVPYLNAFLFLFGPSYKEDLNQSFTFEYITDMLGLDPSVIRTEARRNMNRKIFKSILLEFWSVLPQWFKDDLRTELQSLFGETWLDRQARTTRPQARLRLVS